MAPSATTNVFGTPEFRRRSALTLRPQVAQPRPGSHPGIVNWRYQLPTAPNSGCWPTLVLIGRHTAQPRFKPGPVILTSQLTGRRGEIVNPARYGGGAVM